MGEGKEARRALLSPTLIRPIVNKELFLETVKLLENKGRRDLATTVLKQ